MQISDLNNAGALPTLGAMMRFAAARQKILAHNIANIDTPDFRPMDVSVTQFQQQLREAIDKRREAVAQPALERGVDTPSVLPSGIDSSPLILGSTDEVRERADGSLELTPKEASSNIAYHDRNNRDPERMMQALAENQIAFRMAADLMRRHSEILRMAITQRP